MKTKELIEKIRSLGYIVEEIEDRIEIYEAIDFHSGFFNGKGSMICVIYKNLEFFVSTDYAGMENLKYAERLQLMHPIIKYVMTPTENRVEMKRYVLIHDYIKNDNGNDLSLVKTYKSNEYRLKSLTYDNKYYQAQFTADEIEDLKIELGSKLTDFDIVEVHDLMEEENA